MPDPRKPPAPGGRPAPRPPAPVAKKPAAPAAEPSSGQLGQTALLLGAVMGATTEETKSVQAVFKALGEKNKQVVLELPWYPDGGTHQLVLKARAGDRVSFYNALGHAGGPGDELTDGGLKRRVEPDGSESATLADVEGLFRAGKARALIATLG